jgi:hypothetical protein
LDLKQEIVLGGAANWAIQEDDFHAGPAQLLNQEHLMGIAAGEAVRRMHINASQLPCCGGITQALQSRAKQDGSAVALVDIDVHGLNLMAVSGDALAQGGDLAGDGVIARLTFG